MALALSFLALLGLLYQLYLQRVHNEKSLAPLIQIDLTDEKRLMSVHVQNNGIGPFIVKKLTFTKDGQDYYNVKDCLRLSPNIYQCISINESVRKVVMPGNYLEVFSKRFDVDFTDAEMDDIRVQLAAITLKVEGVDIYKNNIVDARDLQWFIRKMNIPQ